MKVAINALRVSSQGGGGIDHYIVRLVNELADLGLDFDLYTLSPHHFNKVNPDRIFSPISSSPRPVSSQSTSSPANSRSTLRSHAARLAGDWIKMGWTQFVLPLRLLFKKYDLLFSPSQIDALPFSPVKQVITVLDLIPYLFPEQKHKHQFYLRHIFPAALKNSAHVITISENTKKDVVKYFRYDEGKITSIPLASALSGQKWPDGKSVEDVKTKYGLDEYILCVSGNHPHKNITTLIEAYEKIKSNTKCTLLVVGYQDASLQKELDELIQQKNLKERVRFLGHVPAASLTCLYRGAELFVFPSLYEGFGLPPLEALSYGAPVLVSNTSSLPEVVGDAGVYFDPKSPEDLAGKMEKLLNDRPERDRLKTVGLDQAKKFSWKKTAEETLAVFKKVIPDTSIRG